MEEQEEPSVSVKELLARMGKEESDVALGGRSRRRRPGANSVSVGDLTGEIPVVRESAPRGHRAEAASARKWSGWSKREDPDAHLDERDREWDFRVLSGEIERVQDEPNAQDEASEAEELPGGPSIYAEEPRQEEPALAELQTGGSAAPESEERAQGEAPPVGAEDIAPSAGTPEAERVEPEAPEQGEAERANGLPEPQESDPSVAWCDGDAREEEAGHGGDGAKPHKRISAFKADQLERAREVLTKRKSHDEPVHRTGFLGAVDKLAAAELPAWASVALQFLVGFLVGAVLFWVFRQLWRSDHTIFAAVLAVITVSVLVFAVRWFRRKNDWASMAVAAMLGVWVCFGPQAISLLGR